MLDQATAHVPVNLPVNATACCTILSSSAVLPSPSDHRVGDLNSWFSKLNTLPVAAPVYASDRTSRCAPQDSGSGWIRCSFPVGLFHSLLHAGLSRRTVCPTRTHFSQASVGWSVAQALMPAASRLMGTLLVRHGVT